MRGSEAEAALQVDLARGGNEQVLPAYDVCDALVGIVGDDELLAAAGLERIDTRPLVPEPDLPLGDGPHVQLWPHLHGTDGMFFQALRKR